MSLTSDQLKALEAFKEWLDKSEISIPFVLSGYAGSGKTFLSMRFLKYAEKKGLCWTVVAPTHKAVGVLQDALKKEALKPTWYPSTIHRLLRLKLKRKDSIEICEETRETPKSLEQLGLVLIDESSMIEAGLLEIILRCANQSGTRIVFVGDSAQLPPVGEESSPVFLLKRASNSDLKEVVRHQGPVLQLATFIRNCQSGCVPPPCMPSINTHQGVIGFLKYDEWLKKAMDSLRSAAEEDKADEVRILCYTNRVVESLIPNARKAIHGEMAEQLTVLPGEVLISRNAIMSTALINRTDFQKQSEMVIGSNRELVVQDVKPHSCNLAEFGITSNCIPDIPVIKTLEVKASLMDLKIVLRLLPPVGSQSRGLLDKTLKSLANQAKDSENKDSRLTWKQFFLIRDAFASLGPASVLTVHRSQGSSFDKVFIATDVFWPKDITLRKQLVYVAVTRARKSVWLIGENKGEFKQKNWKIFSSENIIQ